MRIDADILCAGSVVGFIVVLSLVARSTASGARTDVAPQKGKELLTQSSEWLRMSEQDATPLFAYRHAAFSLAYLNAARLLAPDAELQKQGVDVHLLFGKLERRLATLSKKISKTCAASNPGGEKPTSVSWL